jgi:large conductance mechanosensitive channel
MALPNIPIPTAKAVSFVKEFRDFILKTNMLALALAVVLGGAATKVVNAIVEDVLGGIIKAIRPTATGWDALNIPVWRFNFKVGPLLNALIEFACVAFVVFIVSKMFIKQASPPPSKSCPECLESINLAASRCKFCSASQPKPEAPAAPVAG